MTLRVVAGLVALWPALAFAQRAEEGAERPAPAPEAPSLLAGAVDPDKYVVGPGDKLLIALWGLQEQTRETEVNAEGRLVLPRIGVFPSAGKTLSALREEVVRRLKSAYPRLNASLTLLRPRSFAVFIVGAVARPGSYRATPVTRVSELIPQSAPLANASTRRLEIRRKGQSSPIRADLIRFSAFGDASADPTLLDGDTVFVPFREFEVEVTGAVRRPGRYELVDPPRIGELLQLAGGLSSDVALALPLRVTTRAEGDRVEARSIAQGPDAAATPLRPGAVVHVPAIADLQRTVTVEGAIRIGKSVPETTPVPTTPAPDEALPTRPVSTQVEYVEGDTVRDVIVKVGGLQPSADGRLSYVLRTRPDGVRERIGVDVVAASAGQGPDLPVQPGDTLVVPSRRDAVMVGGAVYRPGVYPYGRGLKPMDYITLAGGATRTGKPGSSRVLHSTGRSASVSDVEEIEPGDVISVPEATISTAEWINLTIVFANLAVGTTALIYTVTHR